MTLDVLAVSAAGVLAISATGPIVPALAGPVHARSGPHRPEGPRIIGPFRGTLSPRRSVAEFGIVSKRPAFLSWSYRGPAVRFVITDPAGNVDGPGIASPYRLPRAGRYTMTIASNTMAEGIYGPYHITFRLQPVSPSPTP